MFTAPLVRARRWPRTGRALAAAALVGLAGLISRPAPAVAQAPPPPPANDGALFSPPYQLRANRPPFTLRAVFRRLAAVQAGERPFVESRNFAASKRPLRAGGTMRYSRTAGLSLAYNGAAAGAPPSRVLVIDDRGVIERSADGHERSIAAGDHPELGAVTDIYLNLLRGNAGKLFAANDAYYAADARGWRCGLVPKDPDLARRIGRAVISGSGHNVSRIETIAANGDTRQFELGPLQSAVRFPPEVMKAYFRNGEG